MGDWKWIFVLLVFVGGYMYYDKSSKSNLTKTLQNSGVAVDGTIIDGRSTTRRKGGTTYYVKVMYKPEGLGMQKTEIEVSSKFFDRAAKGLPVDVLYLKEDPKQFMIKGEPLASEGEATIALVILLVGIAGTAWIGFDYWKSKQSAADAF